MIKVANVKDADLDVPVLVTIDDTGGAFALREATVIRGDLACRVYQSKDGPMLLRFEKLTHQVMPGDGGYSAMLQGECVIDRSWQPFAVAELPSYSRDKLPSTLRECLADARIRTPVGVS